MRGSTSSECKFKELRSEISAVNTETEGKLSSVLAKYTEVVATITMAYKNYENSDRKYLDLVTNSYYTAMKLSYEARLLELERRTTGWWHFRKKKAMKLDIRGKRNEEQRCLNRAREILGAWLDNNSLSIDN